MAHPTLIYKTYDKREHLNAPQYTRTKQRYRGPRESYKINLEISQLLYSLAGLSEQYENFQEELTDIGAQFLDGGELSNVLDSDGDPVVILGLNEIAAKIAQLRIRINNLTESSEALGRFTETFQSRL